MSQASIPDFFATQQDYIAQLNAMLSVMRASQPIIGEVRMLAHATPPAGWLACDGAEVSRTTYADLFGAIGTLYGAGDGSTTFGVPNLTGRVALGASPGSTGGSNSITLTADQMPAHNHDVVLQVAAVSGAQVPTAGAVLGKGGAQANIYAASTTAADIPLGGLTQSDVGGGDVIDITPAYTGVLYCIYAGA